MTCNDDDCLSCNPLHYCDFHDVEYRWHDSCWMCEDYIGVESDTDHDLSEYSNPSWDGEKND